jgi:hypothetical protein
MWKGTIEATRAKVLGNNKYQEKDWMTNAT